MIRIERLTLAQQQYVETIADLVKRTGEARTTDLARCLGVSLPSASEAVSRLVEAGIAARKSWHEIALTADGQAISQQLERRHSVLRRFMVDVLGMREPDADANACRIEHCVGPAFVNRLTSFADFFERDRRVGARARWRRQVSRIGASARRPARRAVRSA